MRLLLSLRLASLLWLVAGPVSAQPTAPSGLGFKPGTNGTFTFDTGALRGVLRAEGKSVGLQSVTHLATGQRLDQSMGLLSHYRVFTTGKRYGDGAWDWPSTARLSDAGAVEVRWSATEERPFELRAIYRWAAPTTVELETIVTARGSLSRFESFLACYFATGFSNALALTASTPASGTSPVFQPVLRTGGDWQMFPRDDDAVSVIQDGRWTLEPHPVAWVIRPRFVHPLAVRRDPSAGLCALLMARSDECFAIALPHETDGHRSLYLSQFGRDLNAGETARSRACLVVLTAGNEAAWLRTWGDFAER